MNCKKLILLFLVASCAYVPAYGFLVRFLQELADLSAFNTHNREAIYTIVKESVDAYAPKITKNVTTIFSPKTQTVIPEDTSFTLKNIAGGVPQDAYEIVDFIKDPKRFARVGAKMPKGILLHGPGGTGKTSIARAIAGETGAAFFNASGSDFVEVFVGVGPQRIRELFAKARAAIADGTHTKAIIFIDEIDAIGGNRMHEMSSEYRNTLNALLDQLDGFKQEQSIFVIGATNNLAILDKALLRPGRFDRLIEIGLPTAPSREAILRYYCDKLTYTGADTIFTQITQQTPNYSGAELESLVNEAAVYAARENAPAVTEQHLISALQKVREQKRYR